MFNGYHSTDDLFELVRRGGGNTALEVQPAVSGLPMSPPQHPEVQPEPPSEEEMATWLYPIVRGEEFVAEHLGGTGSDAAGLVGVGDQQVPAKEPSKQPMEKARARAAKGKCVEGITSDSGERRKTAAGARRSNYSETHSLTEKKRRCKVNERFRTLQEIVPGCGDKSNQASTLDRTIQYMKSLQQQVQSMSSVGGCNMMPVAAVYPVAPPPYSFQRPDGVIAAQPSMPPPVGVDIDPTRMVPFARPPMLLPLLHHTAVMMPAAPLIYRAPATTPNSGREAGKSRSLHSKKSRSLRHRND